MTLTLELKQKLQQEIVANIEAKIAEALKLMHETSESMKNDTKSSAGDKFETGREMLQRELNNKQVQLNRLLQLQKDLTKINTTIPHHQIGFGSLVSTSLGCYYISVAMGAIQMERETYYALSLASPIGKHMNKCKVGDVFEFQGKQIEILQLV